MLTENVWNFFTPPPKKKNSREILSKRIFMISCINKLTPVTIICSIDLISMNHFLIRRYIYCMNIDIFSPFCIYTKPITKSFVRVIFMTPSTHEETMYSQLTYKFWPKICLIFYFSVLFRISTTLLVILLTLSV